MNLPPYIISKPDSSEIRVVRDRKTRKGLGLIRNAGTRRDPEWYTSNGKGYLRLDDAARMIWVERKSK